VPEGPQHKLNSLLKTPPRYHVEFETEATLRKKLAAAGLQDVEVRGAMFAPLRVLHKVSQRLATSLSAWTLPREDRLSDGSLSRPFAGHSIVTARPRC
jgi:hypothetical protein